MTREEFETWRCIKRFIDTKVDIEEPIIINKYVLLTIHGQVSTVLKLGTNNNVVDGYSIFQYDQYNGQYTKDMINVLVEDNDT